MTMTVDLTPDQEEQLRRQAAGRGLPPQALLQHLLSETLSRLGLPPGTNQERVLGLHAGQAWIAEDFDAPLPDSFWLGEDAREA